MNNKSKHATAYAMVVLLLLLSSCYLFNYISQPSQAYQGDKINVHLEVRTDPDEVYGNWNGEGNIYEDPMFVDPSGNDFHIAKSSPCTGAGKDMLEANGVMCYCPEEDMEFDPRPMPTGAMPDMGADEVDESFVGVDLQEIANTSSHLLCYPNPFREQTTIEFYIQEACNVSLDFYDLSGTRIMSVFEGHYSMGIHKRLVKDTGLSPGSYLCTLRTDAVILVRRIVIL